jgi:glycosyltransferase involved in cell wall biosynthesis
MALLQGGLMLGRGLEVFIDAWALLPSPRPLLVFLGQGPLLGRLRARIAANELDDCVFLGKSVSEDDLIAYSAGADLGLIPYAPAAGSAGLNALYSTPNRLFEYLMARLPVLSWKLPEIERIVAEAGTGWCATWQGPSELASLVQDALTNAEKIGTEAREKAARRFSFEHYQSEWFRRLEHLVMG